MKGLDRSRRTHLQFFAMVTAIALGTLTLASRASAATYTYDAGNLDFPISGGFITTNCDSCILTPSNILAWAFQSAVYGVSVSSTDPGAQLMLDGNSLQATPSAITFGFEPGPTSGDAIFLSNNQSVDYLSQATAASTFIEFPNGIGETDACNPGTGYNGSCIGGLNQGTETIALRTAAVAPEIDAASWVTAATLLAGLLLVTRGRRQRVAV